jgi:hypothetical protein
MAAALINLRFGPLCDSSRTSRGAREVPGAVIVHPFSYAGNRGNLNVFGPYLEIPLLGRAVPTTLRTPQTLLL